MKTLVLLLLISVSFSAFAQKEPGDVNWKKWKVVIPVDAGDGFSKILEGKEIGKALSSGEYNDFFKRNSNNTLELASSHSGITESVVFGNLGQKYSSSEIAEVYYDKKNKNDIYWNNTGIHVLDSRMKAYKIKGKGETYLSRITSINTKGEKYDKVRILWSDGYIYTEVYDDITGGAQYKKLQFAKVDDNMFDFTLKMINGKVSLSIDCDKTGVDKKSVPIAEFRDTEFSKNLFRIGNYFKSNISSDDSVTVQIKYIILTHNK